MVIAFTLATPDIQRCADTDTNSIAVMGEIVHTTARVEEERETVVMAVAAVSTPRRKSPAVTMKARTTGAMGV